jgi:hypothetical protein
MSLKSLPLAINSLTPDTYHLTSAIAASNQQLYAQ